MMDGATFLAWCVQIGLAAVVLAVAIAFIRLAWGPTMADRVVALDMMTLLIVAFCGLFALFSGEAPFLDVALVVAVIGFLATVALARFAERRRARRGDMSEIRPTEETGASQ